MPAAKPASVRHSVNLRLKIFLTCGGIDFQHRLVRCGLRDLCRFIRILHSKIDGPLLRHRLLLVCAILASFAETIVFYDLFFRTLGQNIRFRRTNILKPGIASRASSGRAAYQCQQDEGS